MDMSKFLDKTRKYVNLKYYQYEINSGIYMLEPWEKKMFNGILFFFILMGLISSYFFMPASIHRGMELLGYS